MYIPKKYGQSKIERCPFCQKQSTSVNKQDVPVCVEHKDELLEDIKCACNSPLDILKGKYGIFFSCMKCGNMNMRKMLEINTIKPKPKVNNFQSQRQSYQSVRYAQPAKKTMITVRSDDPRYFD